MLKNLIERLRTNPFYQTGAIILGVLLAVCSLIFSVQQTQIASTPPLQLVTYQARSGAEYSLTVEVARTPQELYQGLRFRTSLAPDHGMLFIFPSESLQTFTMQDTYISLDMIFLNSDRQVVQIYERTATNQAEVLYPSILPAQYVVEASAGWVEKSGLKVGDFLTIK